MNRLNKTDLLFSNSDWFSLFLKDSVSRPRGYKTCFMLHSAEHKSFSYLPTIVGILTLISIIQHLRDLKKETSLLFDILVFISI